MQYDTVGGGATYIDEAISLAKTLLDLLDKETLDSDTTSLETFHEKIDLLIRDLDANKTILESKASSMQDIDNEVTGG